MNSPQLSKISIANLTLDDNKEYENPSLLIRKRRWDEFTLVAAAAVAIPAESSMYTEEQLSDRPWGLPVYQTSPAVKIPTPVNVSPSPSPTSNLTSPVDSTSVLRYRSNSFCSSSSASPSPSPYPSPPASPKRRASLPKTNSTKHMFSPATKNSTPKKRAPLSNRTMKLDINFDEEPELDNDEEDEEFEDELDTEEKKEGTGRKYGRKDLSYLLTTPIDLKTYLAAWLARHTTIETNGSTDPVHHCWKCVPPKGTASSSPQRTTAYIRIAVPRHLRSPGLPGKYQAHHVHAMNLGMLPADPLKMVASRRCGHLWCVAPHHLVWETISENFLRERSGKCVGGDRCPHGPLKCFAFPK